MAKTPERKTAEKQEPPPVVETKRAMLAHAIAEDGETRIYAEPLREVRGVQLPEHSAESPIVEVPTPVFNDLVQYHGYMPVVEKG